MAFALVVVSGRTVVRAGGIRSVLVGVSLAIFEVEVSEELVVVVRAGGACDVDVFRSVVVAFDVVVVLVSGIVVVETFVVGGASVVISEVVTSPGERGVGVVDASDAVLSEELFSNFRASSQVLPGYAWRSPPTNPGGFTQLLTFSIAHDLSVGIIMSPKPHLTP